MRQLRLSPICLPTAGPYSLGHVAGAGVLAWRKWLTFVVPLGFVWACTASPRPQVRPPDPPQVFSEECGGLRVQFTLERKPRSTPVYDVYVTDLAGQPLVDGVRVVLAFTSVGKEDSTTTLVAQPQEAGHYAPAGGFTLTPGSWKVETIVRRANTAEAVCAFYLNL